MPTKSQKGYTDTKDSMKYTCSAIWERDFEKKKFEENFNKKFSNYYKKQQSDKIYELGIRVFTKTGFSDSKFIEISREKSYLSIYFLVVLTLVSGISIAIFISTRINDSQPNVDRNRKEFIQYYNNARRQNDIAKEYDQIESIIVQDTNAVSEQNKSSNRYINIFPYDGNRVILSSEEHKTDYINASYIDVSFSTFVSFFDFLSLTLLHSFIPSLFSYSLFFSFLFLSPPLSLSLSQK